MGKAIYENNNLSIAGNLWAKGHKERGRKEGKRDKHTGKDTQEKKRRKSASEKKE